MTKTPTTPKRPAKAAPRPQAGAEPAAAPGVTRLSRTASLIALIQRKQGATLDEMVAVTGWQRHSVRGALSGAVAKTLGGRVTSEVADGVRRYRAPLAR